MSDDATPSPTPSLRVERVGAVAHVTLDRAERRNAIDAATCTGLRELLGEADQDRTIRAIVIAGTERDFCTGADVTASPDAIAQMTTLDYRFAATDYQALFHRLWDTETPIVSAVTGTVAGAGWMLALLADLVVAAEGARWTHVFQRRGMVPHAGDSYFMPRIIPFHRLNEIALLSEPITSETLHTWGLVNRCVPAADVVPTALALADTAGRWTDSGVGHDEAPVPALARQRHHHCVRGRTQRPGADLHDAGPSRGRSVPDRRTTRTLHRRLITASRHRRARRR